jgi:hypothetical protein
VTTSAGEVTQFLPQNLVFNFRYSHSITNPDMLSERKLLSQLAPELDEDMILRLVGAFNDLRHGYEIGSLTYPYSLRGKFNFSKRFITHACQNSSISSGT